MQIDIGIIGISYICEYIRDLAFDTPKKRYNYVIKQLKESCHPTCSNNFLMYYVQNVKNTPLLMIIIYLFLTYKVRKMLESQWV